MESTCVANVPMKEENVPEAVNETGIVELDEKELLEEFDVVDSWEVDGDDDERSADAHSRKSERKSRDSPYTRRKNDTYSRRDSFRDKYKSRQISHRRSHRWSDSRTTEHRRPSRRLGDEKNDDERHSIEHSREQSSGSVSKVEKLPDLKCTTSLETGEVNVVLLTEGKDTAENFEEKEAVEENNDTHENHPLLLKNPFAIAKLRRRSFQTLDENRIRGSALSPKSGTDSVIRDSRASRHNDRTLSPYRARSKNRLNPSFYDRESNNISIPLSPERYPGHSAYYRRTQEGGRRNRRSREGSDLSRVSSMSSISFISSDEMSPRVHDRKRSPLRTKGYAARSEGKDHLHNLGIETPMSHPGDFDYKLSLLLKEGKQKQVFPNPSQTCTPSEYPSAAWRQGDWTNQNTPQLSSNNYSCDISGSANVQNNAYPEFSQGQYTQVPYYNDSHPTNYLSGFSGDMASSVQTPYNYGEQYPNQIPSQYYPQMTVPATTVPPPYSNPTGVTQFQPMDQQQLHQNLNVAVQPMVNTIHQSYPMGGRQLSYVEIQPPSVALQELLPDNPSQDQHDTNTSSGRPKPNRNRIPIRTNIPLTSEEMVTVEEEPIRTPPPPEIINTWREIESGGKKTSPNSEEAIKKHAVLARCAELMLKISANDPTMKRFKIASNENLQHFSLKEETRQTCELKNQDPVRPVQGSSGKGQFQSPLLRKSTNPFLKYPPWLPGDEDLRTTIASEGCGNSVHPNEQIPKSILKNCYSVQEELCALCVTKRNSMVSVSMQTEKQVTADIGVQVESDLSNIYVDSRYKNSGNCLRPKYKQYN